MASKAAQKQGLKATVIYGVSRDTEDIIKLNYKVFSKDIKSHAGLPSNNGLLNERIVIDDNIICNGDVLVGDMDGVVIIPQEKVEEVLHEVENIKKFETESLNEMIDKEIPLDEVLGIK